MHTGFRIDVPTHDFILRSHRAVERRRNLAVQSGHAPRPNQISPGRGVVCRWPVARKVGPSGHRNARDCSGRKRQPNAQGRVEHAFVVEVGSHRRDLAVGAATAPHYKDGARPNRALQFAQKRFDRRRRRALGGRPGDLARSRPHRRRLSARARCQGVSVGGAPNSDACHRGFRCDVANAARRARRRDS